MKNDIETNKEEIIEGSLEEVIAKVEALKGEGVHDENHFKLDASKGEIKKEVKIENYSNK